MFRFKKAIAVEYNRQGLIYFMSRAYKTLSTAQQKKILNLCAECGGEHHQALFEFVTTDVGATAVCMEHHLSRSTMERMVRKYYERFPKRL